jgi:hypothetical protein
MYILLQSGLLFDIFDGLGIVGNFDVGSCLRGFVVDGCSFIIVDTLLESCSLVPIFSLLTILPQSLHLLQSCLLQPTFIQCFFLSEIHDFVLRGVFLPAALPALFFTIFVKRSALFFHLDQILEYLLFDLFVLLGQLLAFGLFLPSEDIAVQHFGSGQRLRH